MNSPFFSVIIPTLNEEKYLSTILKSLVSQTFRNFEMIVVDGRSDDKTVAVFSKFKSKIPAAKLLVSNKRNVGHQRNLGAKEATGEYLVFFDADVNIEPTFLEEIHIGALKKNFQLATTWIVPDSNRSSDQLILTLGNLGQEIAKVINKPYTGGYNTIIKKDFFLKMHGFREDLKIGEDHDLAIRANKAGVQPVIFKEPYVVWSMRRFRSQGKLGVLRKLAQSAVYTVLIGPITKELFDYQMGGHAHIKKRKKKIKMTQINTYLKLLRKLEKKIDKLLTE